MLPNIKMSIPTPQVQRRTSKSSASNTYRLQTSEQPMQNVKGGWKSKNKLAHTVGHD